MNNQNLIKTPFLLSIIGWSVIVIGTSLLLIINSALLFNWMEQFTPDGSIKNPSRVTYSIYMVFLAGYLSLILIKGAVENARYRPKFSDTSIFIKLLLVISLLLVVMKNVFHDLEMIYKEDGLLENFTALLSVIAAGIFFYLSRKYNQLIQKIFLIAFGAFMLFFAMEEISWGQRIFGWETPEVLSEVNVQNESNLHNIFNSFFELIYFAVNFTVGFVIFFRKQIIEWLERNEKLSTLKTFLPAPHFYYVGFVFIFLLLYTLFLDKGGETNEEIFSFAIFVYALDQLKIFQKQKV